MSPRLTRLTRLAPVLVAALAVLAVSAAPAQSATPCWKLLLNDWYDGKIDHVYPIHCYHDAIKHLPTDIKVYSSAADDINRALQQALDAKKHPAGNTTPAVPTTTTTPTTPTKTRTSPRRSHTTSTSVPPTTIRKKPPGGLSGALRNSSPGGADSFPLPLLILGIIAIVLVLAGVGGMLWRRYHGPGATP